MSWVDWFNHRRLLDPIGNIPPAEAEERYYAMLDESAIAAWRTPNGLRGSRGGSGAITASPSRASSVARAVTSSDLARVLLRCTYRGWMRNGRRSPQCTSTP